MTLTQPLKWHGGKHDLASFIISRMPPRCANPNKPDPADSGWLHYVEPYFGGGAVLLGQDPDGISEVVNDRNHDLTNFWRVLQNPDAFSRFRRCVEAVPFSELEFNDAAAPAGDAVDRAVRFFVRCRQSLAGRMKGFTGITKTRTRRGMNNEVSAWLTCVEGLPAVHDRLKRVLILNDEALTVIRKQDGSRTFLYLDPPYLDSTRTSPDVTHTRWPRPITPNCSKRSPVSAAGFCSPATGANCTTAGRSGTVGAGTRCGSTTTRATRR
jgi:DNA adenine methylase